MDDRPMNDRLIDDKRYRYKIYRYAIEIHGLTRHMLYFYKDYTLVTRTAQQNECQTALFRRDFW